MQWEILLSSKRIGGMLGYSYKDMKYPRNEFAKDYRRIVSSASFRRLQDKTQVFPLDKSDFIRTRLTHSIETASFAKELGNMAVKEIFERYENSSLDSIPSEINNIPDILMCAGLLHDIGNPPFGHFGEVVIGDWFKENLDKLEFLGKKLSHCLTDDMKNDFMNFEGNAQALRLLTKLHFMDSDCGMNLTNAVLNTLVKYPSSSSMIDSEHENIKYHKMGYFYSEKKVFEEIASNTGAYNPKNKEFSRHPLTFLLEAADDVAYSTADLEDGFKKKMFSFYELVDFLEERYQYYYENKRLNNFQSKYTKELIGKLRNKSYFMDKGNVCKKIEDIDLYVIQNWIIDVQEWFAYCAFTGFKQHYDEIMSGEYEKDLLEGTNHEYSLIILKEAIRKFIFPAKEIVILELAAKTIIHSLLDKFIPAVLYFDFDSQKPEYKQSKADKKLMMLLSGNHIENYKFEVKNIEDEYLKLYYKLLLVTDFISGMTDSYAKTLYQELNGY